MQQLTELLFGPMDSHPVVYAMLVGAIVVVLCSLHGELDPAVRGFWRRAHHFTLRYGLPVAALQVLLHRWLAGR